MGDELMAAGEAQAMSAEYSGRKITICGRDGRPRWHPVWAGNPAICQPHEKPTGLCLTNGPGVRPYAASYTTERWTWVDYQPIPADVSALVGVRRRDLPDDAVIVEPNIKPRASVNKAWPWERWCDLVRRTPSVPWVQIGAGDYRQLPGVLAVRTPSIADAVTAMFYAAGYVGHEGGLHHLAAAVKIPAVVLFGGFISPTSTGYRNHANLFTGGRACGSRLPCKHCEAAMSAISVDLVIETMREHGLC